MSFLFLFVFLLLVDRGRSSAHCQWPSGVCPLPQIRSVLALPLGESLRQVSIATIRTDRQTDNRVHHLEIVLLLFCIFNHLLSFCSLLFLDRVVHQVARLVRSVEIRHHIGRAGGSNRRSNGKPFSGRRWSHQQRHVLSRPAPGPPPGQHFHTDGRGPSPYYYYWHHPAAATTTQQPDVAAAQQQGEQQQ